MYEKQLFASSKENTGYAYAVGRIRALETRLLDRTDIGRLLEAESASEALKALSEGEYESAMSGISEADFETGLNIERERVYALVDELSLDPQLTRIFREQWDFHNLKALLKSSYLETPGTSYEGALVESGTVPIDDLRSAIEPDEEDWHVELPTHIASALQAAQAVFDEDHDPRMIDIVIDKHAHAYACEQALASSNSFLSDYLQAVADLTNIKSFIRIKMLGETVRLLDQVLLPYGSLDNKFFVSRFDETVENFAAALSNTPYAQVVSEGVRAWSEEKSLAVYEKLSDNYLVSYIGRAKYLVFGVEPLIAYLLAKEHELKLIRIVMIGKLNDLPAETIQERLRDTYV